MTATKRFLVHIAEVVSTSVEVEADSAEEAAETYNESPDMPASMTHGAFGQITVDEAGEWEAVAITDTDTGEQVWENPRPFGPAGDLLPFDARDRIEQVLRAFNAPGGREIAHAIMRALTDSRVVSS